MKKIFLLFAMFLFGCSQKPVQKEQINPEIAKPITNISKHIGKIKINDTMSIRLLVLKHCPDDIADTDSNQAVKAANLAASKGLNIENIGNYHVDTNGQTDSIVWAGNFTDLEGLKRFISEQMKIEAKPNDTFVVYTIGHGSGGGSVMRLGQRDGIVKAIAEAAEENNQETFWWQLSCHAAAKLPPISSLTEKQQQLFSMTASSPGDELSYFCTQGKLMETVFSAMADNDKTIDPNEDNAITAGELKQFMITKFGVKRGNLLYARSDDEVIFHLIPGKLPVIDHNNQPSKYPIQYVPVPKR